MNEGQVEELTIQGLIVESLREQTRSSEEIIEFVRAQMGGSEELDEPIITKIGEMSDQGIIDIERMNLGRLLEDENVEEPDAMEYGLTDKGKRMSLIH
ncbi:hypothetical protein KKA95_03900 [Patescibacteria group bacterium]|nr:hypothetical protein [Patescibacteria group bacterium]